MIHLRAECFSCGHVCFRIVDGGKLHDVGEVVGLKGTQQLNDRLRLCSIQPTALQRGSGGRELR